MGPKEKKFLRLEFKPLLERNKWGHSVNKTNKVSLSSQKLHPSEKKQVSKETYK